MSSASAPKSANSSMMLNIFLWLAQILLAVLFGMAGVMKTFLPPADMIANGITAAAVLPLGLMRFIGIAELSGAIGVLLPALTRIQPRLTPLAALGFVTIQVLAIGYHVMHGDFFQVLPLNAVLLSLSLFVLWGRGSKAPIRPR